MTIDELRATVDRSRIGNRVSLDPGALLEGLSEAFSTYLGQASAVVDLLEEPIIATDSVTLRGSADVLGIGDVRVQLELRVSGDELRARLTGELPADWSASPLLARLREPALPIVLEGDGATVSFEWPPREGGEPIARLGARAVLGGVPFRVGLSLPELKVSAEPEGELPPLHDVIQALIADLPIPPELRASGVTLRADPEDGSFALDMKSDSTWNLALGPATLALGGLTVAASRSGTDAAIAGALTGRVSIAGSELDLRLPFGEAPTLSGRLPAISLSRLARTLGSGIEVPSLLDLTLPESTVTVRLTEPTIVDVKASSAGMFQSVVLRAADVSGAWTLAVILVPSASEWKLSKLSPLLAPLDGLVLSSPRIVFASGEVPRNVALLQGEELDDAIEEGLQLLAKLDLRGFGLDLIGELLHETELAIATSLDDLAGSIHVDTKLPFDVPLLPGVVELRTPFLRLTPQPLAVAVRGQVHVSIFGAELPVFLGGIRATVDGAAASLAVTFSTIEPWERPFGVPGLRLEHLALDGELLPEQRIAVAGEITLSKKDGTKRMKAACAFSDGVPRMLYGKFNEAITIFDLIGAVTGTDLQVPEVLLGVQLRDFELSVVPPPLAVTIGDETFPPGFHLEGTASFLGLEASCLVNIDPATGFTARGELSPLRIANVLEISGAGPHGGPAFSLRDRESPFVWLSGRVVLLGTSQETTAVLGSDGLTIAISQVVGPVAVDLKARVQDPSRFAAEGSFSFRLSVDVGPIQAPGIGIDMGTISLVDVALTGSARISAASGSFEMHLTAAFRLFDIDFQIGDLALSSAPSSLEELPVLIAAELQRNAAAIFGALLSNADAWVRFLQQGVVKAVENVVKVLHDVFEQSYDTVAKTLHETLGMPAEEIASQLKRSGVDGPAAVVVLGPIVGPAAATVALVNQVFGTHIEPPHVDIPIHIELPPIELPPIHIELPPIPLPHFDVPAPPNPLPHVDVHVDHIDIFHW